MSISQIGSHDTAVVGGKGPGTRQWSGGCWPKDGVGPDSKDSDGRTPLSWAARNGHEAVAKLRHDLTV